MYTMCQYHHKETFVQNYVNKQIVENFCLIHTANYCYLCQVI
jgi:hypothetical protein